MVENATFKTLRVDLFHICVEKSSLRYREKEDVMLAALDGFMERLARLFFCASGLDRKDYNFSAAMRCSETLAHDCAVLFVEGF